MKPRVNSITRELVSLGLPQLAVQWDNARRNRSPQEIKLCQWFRKKKAEQLAKEMKELLKKVK